MAVFALVHGSGDGGWAWRLVQHALRDRGHEAVAPDLPTDREDATWDDCVSTVVDSVAGAEDLVLVGHSAGGFVVPLVAQRVDPLLQVYVAGMVPRSGETAAQWFDDVGWFEAMAEQSSDGVTGSADPLVGFYHDVPRDLAAQAMARERPTSQQLGNTQWPPVALSGADARYVVTTRDRFIPSSVQRRVAAERLGITRPDEIDAGHCPHLSRPEELAGMLAGLFGGVAG